MALSGLEGADDLEDRAARRRDGSDARGLERTGRKPDRHVLPGHGNRSRGDRPIPRHAVDHDIRRRGGGNQVDGCAGRAGRADRGGERQCDQHHGNRHGGGRGDGLRMGIRHRRGAIPKLDRRRTNRRRRTVDYGDGPRTQYHVCGTGPRAERERREPLVRRRHRLDADPPEFAGRTNQRRLDPNCERHLPGGLDGADRYRSRRYRPLRRAAFPGRCRGIGRHLDRRRDQGDRPTGVQRRRRLQSQGQGRVG